MKKKLNSLKEPYKIVIGQKNVYCMTLRLTIDLQLLKQCEIYKKVDTQINIIIENNLEMALHTYSQFIFSQSSKAIQ